MNEYAEDITHASNLIQFKKKKDKYSGGRYLDAIWSNPNLNTNQCVVLQCIASFVNFTGKFENSWVYVSISKFQERTKLGKDAILRVINGFEPRKQKGLIELGYLKKRLATREKQLKGEANDFCLTEKIFDELNVEKQEKKHHTLSPTERGGESPTERGGESPTERQSPKDLSPKDLNPVCVKEPEKQKAEQPKPTHTHFEEKKTKTKDKSIPAPLYIALANYIQTKKTAKHFDNEEAKRIITEVIQQTGCTLAEYAKKWSEFENLDSKPSPFHLRKFTEQTVTQAFISWMKPQEQVLREEEPQLPARRMTIMEILAERSERLQNGSLE